MCVYTGGFLGGLLYRWMVAKGRDVVFINIFLFSRGTCVSDRLRLIHGMCVFSSEVVKKSFSSDMIT